jgi:hypothetical protein
MNLRDHIEQIVANSNKLEVHTKHSRNKDIQALNPYLEKLFLSYNGFLRSFVAELGELGNKLDKLESAMKITAESYL